MILSAREHFEEVMASARRALDEVIEQTERVTGGDCSLGTGEQSNSGGGSKQQSASSTHSPASPPMGKKELLYEGP